MKRILLSLLMLSGVCASAQETAQKQDFDIIYVEAGTSAGKQIGVVWEFESWLHKKSSDYDKHKRSQVVKLFYSADVLKSTNQFVNDVDGKGFAIELGSRSYFNKEGYKGLYYGNYLMGGSMQFENSNYATTGDAKFSGTYTYFSFFSPEVGFKFNLSKKLVLDLHIGTAWLIEFKGKGDLDNRYFDNWLFRTGVALGYNF
ncbi:MAG TPA: hypothetical protein VLZ11_03500 [Flavobacterium sp.]|nr:hypothetical protein [Flavobacterium sp.]